MIGAWANEGGICDEEGSGAEAEWVRSCGWRGHVGREQMWAGAGCLWEQGLGEICEGLRYLAGSYMGADLHERAGSKGPGYRRWILGRGRAEVDKADWPTSVGRVLLEILWVPLPRQFAGVPQGPGRPGSESAAAGGHGSPGKLGQQPSFLRPLSYEPSTNPPRALKLLASPWTRSPTHCISWAN